MKLQHEKKSDVFVIDSDKLFSPQGERLRCYGKMRYLAKNRQKERKEYAE